MRHLLTTLVLSRAWASDVVLTFDTTTPLRQNLSASYVSVNIDTASLGLGFDFSDPVLHALVRQLSPILLRVGGTASHGLLWTGQPGLPCGSCGALPPQRGQVCVSTDCLDQLGGFLNATGARLLLDLAPTRLEPANSSSAWNSSNSEALMAWAATRPYASRLAAWQVGNEQPTITTGTQLGLDFLRARDLARKHGLPAAIIGPSLPKKATPAPWLLEYFNTTCVETEERPGRGPCHETRP